MFVFFFFGHIGCSRNSHVDSNGQQGYENVTDFLLSRLSGLLLSSLWNGMYFLRCFFSEEGGSSSVFPCSITPFSGGFG